jgi:TRAP transporter TAXI family solute receptor
MKYRWRPAGRRIRGAALIATAGLALLSGLACREASPAQSPRPGLRIATAFGPLTQPLAAEYRRTLKNVDVQTVAAPNSIDVIHEILEGRADFGVAYSDDTYAGYWNQTADNGAKSREIRGVALLQPLSEYLLIRGNSGIHQIRDLDGRVVGFGPKDTSSFILGPQVLEAFGVHPSAVKVFGSRADAAAAMTDRTVDGVFLPGYVYPDDVFWRTVREGAYFIPIAGPNLQRLRERNPFVRLTTIPRNTIDGQTSIIPTIGIDMVVVCGRDIDESLVYDLTKQLFIAFPRLSSVEASLRFLNFDEASATPIPLHPGAARYFRERELSR